LLVGFMLAGGETSARDEKTRAEVVAFKYLFLGRRRKF
jgi:hypothetical protein